MPHLRYDDWHGNWRPLMDATERHRLAMIDAETCSMDELEAAAAILDRKAEEPHVFQADGFVTRVGGWQRCAICGREGSSIGHREGG